MFLPEANNRNNETKSMETDDDEEDAEYDQGMVDVDKPDNVTQQSIDFDKLTDTLKDHFQNLNFEESKKFQSKKFRDELDKHMHEFETAFCDDDENNDRNLQRRPRYLESKKRSSITSLEEEFEDQSLRKSKKSRVNDNDDDADYDDDIISDVESIEYNGMTYSKNKWYVYETNQESNQRLVHYGILDFLKEDDDNNGNGWKRDRPAPRVRCIRIIAFKETVLERVQDTASIFSPHRHLRPTSIGTYLQLHGSEKTMSLDDLGRLAGNINNDMPYWKYMKREIGAATQVMFGLVDVSKPPKRNGLRKCSRIGFDGYCGAGLFGRGIEESTIRGVEETATFNIKYAVEKEIDPVRSYANIHDAEIISSLIDDHDDDGKDNDNDKKWTIKFSKKNKTIFRATMRNFLLKVETDKGFRDALVHIDFAILSPPCQGFSKMNRFKGGNALGNNEESKLILKVAKLWGPKIIVFENVFGLWERKHIEEYLQPISYGLIDMDYNVQVWKLNAMDFGDAQNRRRLFIIASSKNVGVPDIPKPTHCHLTSKKVFGGVACNRNNKLTPYVTVRDLLINEENNFPEESKPLNDDNGELKTFSDRPCKTVLASKSYIHYCKNRKYSLHENALLMGQERAFVEKLIGKDDVSKQRMIGNGVPMGMSKAIGSAIYNVLKFNWEGEE